MKGHFIKEWRSYRGYTQAALAERIGSNKAHISRIEHGLHQYTQGTLEKIAVALGCSPVELIARPPDQQLTEMDVIFEDMNEDQRSQLLRIARALKGGSDVK